MVKSIYIPEFNLRVSEHGEVSRLIKGVRRIYSHNPCKAGYQRVGVMIKGKRKGLSVHCLVATAFLPNMENKPEVNHIDGNKGNNHFSNLEWVTKQENMDHAKNTGLWNKDMAWSDSKLRNIDVKKDFIDGLSKSELCLKYNLQRPNLNKIIRECA